MTECSFGVNYSKLLFKFNAISESARTEAVVTLTDDESHILSAMRMRPALMNLILYKFFTFVFVSPFYNPLLFNRDSTNKGTCEGSCSRFAGMLVAWETGLKLCVTDGGSSALQ